MSRPEGPKTQKQDTNNLRNDLVSQVTGGLLFRCWVTPTNRIGCHIMRLYGRSILCSCNLT